MNYTDVSDVYMTPSPRSFLTGLDDLSHGTKSATGDTLYV